MRILVTGSRGQVGLEVVRALRGTGQILASDRSHMDLGDPDSVRSCFRECAPDLTINCAAFTAVDRAESDPDLALRVNAEGPGVLAEEAARRHATLIQLSTDYVFDGAKETPYLEDDPPNPRSAYGRSKLAGEQAVTASGCSHLIVRTSWVYASSGSNFLRTVLSRMERGEPVRVVDDQRGSPTWARDLAEALASMVTRLRDDPAFRDPSAWSGLYHVAGDGAASRFEFAREIARWARPAGEPGPAVVPVSSADYPTPAPRPANSALSCERVRERFGIALPLWQISTKRVVEECRR